MQSRSWLFSYLALAVIWGLSFALIKQALAAMTPLQVTTARMGLGALTVCVFLLVARRFPRPNAREWRNLFVLGVVGLGLPFALIAFAETRITSILAGLLNSSVPLFAAIFVALLIPAERPDRTQVVGLLVGFAGIGVLVGVWNISTSGIDLVGVTAMILSGLCYGFGTAFGRVSMANSDLAGTQLTAMQLLTGTGIVALLLIVDPGVPPAAPTLVTTASILALGIPGTGVAMALFWGVLRQAGATVAATVTYVIPLVSTTVGAVLLAEPLSWNQVVGGLIVVGGIALTQWSQLTGRGVMALSRSGPVVDE